MTFSETLRERPAYGVIGLILPLNFLISWYIAGNKEYFASLVPDATHVYPISYRGGHMYYFTRWLGAYLVVSFVGHFVLLAALLILGWYYSRRGPRSVQ